MKNKNESFFEEATTNLTANTGGAVIGTLIGGPVGGVVGVAFSSVLVDIGKRMLSPREASRIELVRRLSEEKIQARIDSGAVVRQDLNKEELEDFLEGTLLTARESYEEKKIPLIANLVSKSLFINTPLKSLMQALNYGEQLTYRQLCIISVIGQNGGNRNNKFNLTRDPLSKTPNRKFDDNILSTYQDLSHLVTLGIIGQVFSLGIPASAAGVQLTAPAYTELLYPGLVIFNTMDLESIAQHDLRDIIKIFSG